MFSVEEEKKNTNNSQRVAARCVFMLKKYLIKLAYILNITNTKNKNERTCVKKKKCTNLKTKRKMFLIISNDVFYKS